MSRAAAITIAAGVLLAASRIALSPIVEPTGFEWLSAYKDAAHLFMGGLFVAAIRDHKRWQWVLFWSLNLIEVACAMIGRA
jgi:hypothetical protein